LKLSEDRLRLNEDRLKLSEDRLRLNEDRLRLNEDRLRLNEDRLRLNEDRLRLNEHRLKLEKLRWRVGVPLNVRDRAGVAGRRRLIQAKTTDDPTQRLSGAETDGSTRSLRQRLLRDGVLRLRLLEPLFREVLQLDEPSVVTVDRDLGLVAVLDDELVERVAVLL